MRPTERRAPADGAKSWVVASALPPVLLPATTCRGEAATHGLKLRLGSEAEVVVPEAAVKDEMETTAGGLAGRFAGGEASVARSLAPPGVAVEAGTVGRGEETERRLAKPPLPIDCEEGEEQARAAQARGWEDLGRWMDRPRCSLRARVPWERTADRGVAKLAAAPALGSGKTPLPEGPGKGPYGESPPCLAVAPPPDREVEAEQALGERRGRQGRRAPVAARTVDRVDSAFAWWVTVLPFLPVLWRPPGMLTIAREPPAGPALSLLAPCEVPQQRASRKLYLTRT